MFTSPPPQHGLAQLVRTRIVDPCQHPGPWKTRVWNSGGHRPAACDELERISRVVNGGNVWRGSQVPSAEQGIKVLGSPLGHIDFVDAHEERPLANIRCSLRESRLSLICSLHDCSSPTALQPRPPTFGHCSGQCHSSPRPWRVGSQKHCADSNDAGRHPKVAREFETRLEAGVEPSCLGAAATVAGNLVGIHSHGPHWHSGLSLPPTEPEIGVPLHGWSCSRELQLMPEFYDGDRARGNEMRRGHKGQQRDPLSKLVISQHLVH